MRIDRIELCNFRSFYGTSVLELGGKNLLLYGENGTGKSSLALAIQRLLETSRPNGAAPKFEYNLFADPSTSAHGKLELSDGEQCVWDGSSGFSTNVASTTVADAAKANNFLDYRTLLKTYFLAKEEKVQPVRAADRGNSGRLRRWSG